MIVGILQARMSSSRLPGKVMLEAAGKTMLEHMIRRISRSKKLDKIIVATTEKKVDDIIVQLCQKMNIQYFRGSEDDVLSRYQQAAEISNASTVVRLCSDSPILDASTIDTVVESYLSADYDYVNNLVPTPRTYSDGMSVEVFSSKILKEAYINAKKPSEREHVTFYIWMQPTKFKIYRVDYKKDISKYRFNLDYMEDYIFLKKIFENLYFKDEFFSMEDTIEWLEKNPEVLRINSHIKPNQGWISAFERDKLKGF